jgi:hypothetical protein
MIDERDNEETDERLSKAYRELGAPRTPEYLNRRVLKLAARGGKTNDLFAAWMKPVAWAATLGISLAFLLQLSDLPTAPVPSDVVTVDGPNGNTSESIADDAREELVLDNSETFKSEARRRNNSFAASAPAASFRRPMQRDDSAADCGATARLSADDWRECIDRLRESGATAVAEREYAAFILQFPAEQAELKSN